MKSRKSAVWTHYDVKKKWKYVVDSKNIKARENAHKSSPSQTLTYMETISPSEICQGGEGERWRFLFYAHTTYIITSTADVRQQQREMEKILFRWCSCALLLWLVSFLSRSLLEMRVDECHATSADENYYSFEFLFHILLLRSSECAH